MSSGKQRAYDRYNNAITEGSRLGLHNVESMHQSFADYMNSLENLSLDTVDLTPIDNLAWSKQVFYQTLLSKTFHVYYPKQGELDPRYFPQAFGPGIATVEFRRRTNGDYVMSHRDLTNSEQTFTVENPDFWVLNSKSLNIEDGLAKMCVKMLSKKVNGASIWNYQLSRGDVLMLNLYLVDFQVQENA